MAWCMEDKWQGAWWTCGTVSGSHVGVRMRDLRRPPKGVHDRQMMTCVTTHESVCAWQLSGVLGGACCARRLLVCHVKVTKHSTQLTI